MTSVERGRQTVVEVRQGLRLADAVGTGGQEQDLSAIRHRGPRQFQGPLGGVQIFVVGQPARRRRSAAPPE